MAAPTCSDGSAALSEPLAGTSPYAVAWMALEQNGPWGARAFTASHLDPEVGQALEDAAGCHDVRPCLIRRPGRHADAHSEHERRVLVAYTRPGHSWLLEGRIEDPADLLETDWAALRAGDKQAVRRSLRTLLPSGRTHLLVCTNAKRDVCCAVKGRPIALGAAAAHPEQVWEVTHTSGHRFAPTALLLPAGTLHGRLDVATALEVLRAGERGATVLAGSRGRSTWPGPAQAAELVLRQRYGVLGLDALAMLSHEQLDERCWATVFTHVDGRSWRVVVESRQSEGLRAESCGKALRPMSWITLASEQTVS